MKSKGPLVWLDMDQQELDDAYTQAAYAPNRDQVTGRWASNSVIARQRLGAPRRFSYGPTPIEGLDVFSPAKANAPINVFIHGGAWRGGEAKNYAFAAEPFVRAGAHFVALDFNNVIETGGNLMVMADQVRRAVAWVYRNAAQFGGDPERLYVSGTSSGGHLTAVTLTTDWQREFGLPADIVKGALCSSGMYDLKPVRLSVRSSYVNFTNEIEQALSPQRHLQRISCPVAVAYGTFETPEFQRQARDFASALEKSNKKVELVVGQGYNHFEMTETLGNPYGLLGSAALELMGLAGI
jgi:arylformamidase